MSYIENEESTEVEKMADVETEESTEAVTENLTDVEKEESTTEVENPKEKEAAMKRYFTLSSLRLLALWIAALLAQVVLPILLAIAATKNSFVGKHYYEVALVASFLLDLIMFGVINLAMIKNEKSKPEKKKMPLGKLLLVFWCGYVFATIFSIIGNNANEALLAPFGYDWTETNVSLDMISIFSTFGGMMFEIVFFGILGPLMEELIFRKTIIDNFSKYGMGAAILVSSVTFGLFHGNVSQCFMAMALGAVFAYVYSLTGKIWYSVAMHIIVNVYNIVTAMIAMSFVSDETTQMMDELVYEFYQSSDFTTCANAMANYFSDKPDQLVLVAIDSVLGIVFNAVLIVGFFVLLANIKKFVRFRRSINLGEKGAKTYAMFNVGMVLCYICAFLLFAFNYVMDFLNSPFAEKLFLKN